MSKTTGSRTAGALLALIALAAPAWAAPRQTPSGLPVPRYVTLKNVAVPKKLPAFELA